MHRIGVPLLCAALLLAIWAGNAGASRLENISGATQTTACWRQSLQAALTRTLKP
jgi:hypothetical protein